MGVKDSAIYTGKQLDDPTGLYYFNARYYDPNLGRFISEDSAKDGANWYSYCSNNPLKYVDPSGKVYDLADVFFAAWSYSDLYKHFSLANLGWAALDTVTLLPGLPSSGYMRRGAQAIGIYGVKSKVVHHK